VFGDQTGRRYAGCVQQTPAKPQHRRFTAAAECSRRRNVATALTLTVVLLTGCTATVDGQAAKAPVGADSDGAVVALMNTGVYPIRASSLFGPAGSDQNAQRILEAQRMAVNVDGRWQVDAKLTFRPADKNTFVTGPHMDAASLATDGLFTQEQAGIAAAHGYQAGFSSMRVSDPGGPQRGLINAVLMFPDPASAAAAATEMADVRDELIAVAPLGDQMPRPLNLNRHPEALALALDHPDFSMTAVSYDAHGRYLLYEWAHTPNNDAAGGADQLISSALSAQADHIDRFVPTDPTKWPDLPKDPTGELLSKTLASPDNRVPDIVGAWQPAAWLHFEDDPLAAMRAFDDAGVDAVAQRTDTVYRAANPDAASRLADHIAAQIAAQPGVQPTPGVPGLPTAQCFTRPDERRSTEVTPSVARIFWHYKCVGRAERYAYTAVSGREDDVKQQTAAQYRILAGQ
jgi:hypothetical protein